MGVLRLDLNFTDVQSNCKKKKTPSHQFGTRHYARTKEIPHTCWRARRGPSPTAKHGTVRAQLES